LRKKEREIEKLTRENQLKSALIEKNDEIERANRELIQVNEELRQFAYVASHDLKEPLRQVGSYISLLRRKYAHLFDDDAQTYFGFVTEGVNRLNRLFDSLMQYTTVARIEKEISAVDMNRLLASVEAEYASEIAKAKATVRYLDLPVIQTGGKLLRHVIKALLDNSLKFRRPGVAANVQVRIVDKGDNHQIEFQDNGIGISQEYQDKVFGLFQMLHPKADYIGTGVGLAIAQKTVQRLGGRIWFDVNPDGSAGTTFFITLPKEASKTSHNYVSDGVAEAY
jgi:light-regulated signal transduction histidine kinase (bacteriophytochrome)